MANHPENLRESKIHGTLMFPLAVYEISKEPCVVRHHWHEEIELIYMEEGEYQVEINMERMPGSKPAFFFVNQEELHSIRMKEDCVEKALVFDLHMLASEIYDGVQSQFIIPILSGVLRFPKRVEADSAAGKELEREFMTVMRQQEKEKTSSYLRIKASLFQILAILEEHSLFENVGESRGESHEKAAVVKTVLSYIREHYREKIYIKDLAGLVSLNEQYLCRFFKKAIDKTLVDYIVEYRIEQAARQIAEGNDKIVEVCFNCGFDNMGYFIRRFKALKGCTPSAYRKQFKMSK